MSNKTVTVEELNESILQLLEDERKRISLDLHDGVQNKLRLLRDKYLKRYADSDFADDMQSIMDGVRHVAYQLIPKNLQQYPLVDYLNIYAATLNQTYATKFKIDFQTNVKMVVPKAIEIELFKIVQEGFNNMLKYAANSPVFCIRYLQHEEHLMLILQDFGDGFDLDAAFEKNTIGLNGIETRAQRIGANVKIETNRFEGCKIKVTVPVADWVLEEEKSQNVPVAYHHNTQPPKKRLSTEIKHILIVDNQPEYGEFLQKLIRDTFADVTVEYRKSAKEARNYLQKIDYQSDVVITDITMPEESGIRMIKNLRKIEAAKDIEFIIYSINDNPAYVYQARKVLKINTYIWKETLYEDKHPIINALENLDEGYLSPNIKSLDECFPEEYSVDKKDGLYRKIFKIYLKEQREMFCGTSVGENLITTNELLKKVKTALEDDPDANYLDEKTLGRYFRHFLRHIGFNKEMENHYLLLQFSEDLDLL